MKLGQIKKSFREVAQLGLAHLNGVQGVAGSNPAFPIKFKKKKREDPVVGNDAPNQERRQFIRIEKHFLIAYYNLDDPSQSHDVTQLKNISLGGMCFIASHDFSLDTRLGIDLKTPYAEETHLQAYVIETKKTTLGDLFETRVGFSSIDEQARKALEKIIQTFIRIRKEGKGA